MGRKWMKYMSISDRKMDNSMEKQYREYHQTNQYFHDHWNHHHPFEH